MEMDENSLDRFYKVYQQHWTTAFNEVQNGRKRTHWMWFIFPQIAGLGFSEVALHYAIRDLNEAERFLQDEVVFTRLIRISKVLLSHKGKTAHEIFGSLDDLKLCSCMTLFNQINGTPPVFQQVIDLFFKSKKDAKTLAILADQEQGGLMGEGHES